MIVVTRFFSEQTFTRMEDIAGKSYEREYTHEQELVFAADAQLAHDGHEEIVRIGEIHVVSPRGCRFSDLPQSTRDSAEDALADEAWLLIKKAREAGKLPFVESADVPPMRRAG